MLIVNKQLDNVRLILTVTEKWTGQGNCYQLVIHSTYTNKDFTFILSENTSTNQQRYDEFFIPGAELANVEPGQYSYTVYEHMDSTSTNYGILEQGVLLVKDNSMTVEQTVEDQYDRLPVTDDQDDFLVYDQD